MMQSTARQTLRFRDFELDVEAYQLRRQGRPIKLERQPMELLILLIERRGCMVSRGDIAERLWGKDVFVDVETGVNIAIRKIRQALRDPAEKPAFVETVVGKGYRFVAPVEVEPAGVDAGAAEPADEQPETKNVPASSNPARLPVGDRVVPFHRVRIVGLLACVALAALAVSAWFAVRATPVRLAVLPFTNLTHDPDREYLADGLTEEATVTLAQIAPQQVSVIGRQSAMLLSLIPALPFGRCPRVNRCHGARDAEPVRTPHLAAHDKVRRPWVPTRKDTAAGTMFRPPAPCNS